MAKKNLSINYTNRDFATIKQELVEYARRYYSDSFKDFNEAGFGSLMLDTVAYVGDILSFYLDYQVNESFLDSAVEYDNVIRLANQLGYNFQPNPTSYGFVSLYILVPALSAGAGPDPKYMPIVRKGTSFSATNGAVFTLADDVNFAKSDNEIVVGRVNESTGVPTQYAIKTLGKVLSGEFAEKSFTVAGYERFLTISVPGANIAEIISIFDIEGHEYYEVDFLSQDVAYAEIPNRVSNIDTVRSILKPFAVPRRFIAKNTTAGMNIQFGHGSDSEIKNGSVADPSSVVLQQHGRKHIIDDTFDPSKLNKTGKFGIAPSNTTLFVTYRQNSAANVNVPSNALTTVANVNMSFGEPAVLNQANLQTVINSLEVTNDLPIIGDTTYPSSDEIKKRATDFFATQNRIVTQTDYISYVYNMPEKFGAIKRAGLVKDSDSFKRNLNLYVISEGVDGNLALTNSLIKQNLKTWLNKNKMVHDTVDILDATILNLGIDYVISADDKSSKYDILEAVTQELKEFFKVRPNIGESLNLSDIYSVIDNVRGVTDTVDVDVRLMNGASYTGVFYNISANISPDGRFLELPKDFIWEIKFPNSDIKGSIQ
tara:strand:+ start:1179 stop:2972 length:1794 start_codon:yes stop_codon:yes gene_type:complete